MRTIVAIAGLLAVVGGLASIKGCQVATIIASGKAAEEMGPPPEAVGAFAATAQSWEAGLDAVGSVASAKGVAVSAEVPGQVTRIAFESGQRVDGGDVLVELDSRIERAELASARASRDLARTDARRARKLAKAGAIAREELDQAEANLETTGARVAALRAQVARKTVRAPFAGRLGIRQVALGEYLGAGAPIAVLEATDDIYVDFSLPQQRLADVSVGMPVRIDVEGTGAPPQHGTVVAIEPAVDVSTRAVQLRASVPDAGEQLRPGMFVNVEVVLPERVPVVVVPLTAIVHAPYGDSVFVIEAKPADEPGMRRTPDGATVMVARQQFVRTGPRRGDFVAVVEGLEAGQRVVSEGAFKLRNGSPIVVTDGAAPEPQLEPHPENR